MISTRDSDLDRPYEIPLVFSAFRSFDMLQAVSLVLGIVVSVYQLRAYMQ